MSKLFLLLPCRAVQSRRRWGELAWLLLETAGWLNPGFGLYKVSGWGRDLPFFFLILERKESGSLSPGSHLQICKRKSTFLRRSVYS